MLAISLLIVGVPVVATPAGADQRPALTLDICHPAQALGAASIQCTVPLPSVAVFQQALECCGTIDAAAQPTVTIAAGPPDTPPPKP